MRLAERSPRGRGLLLAAVALLALAALVVSESRLRDSAEAADVNRALQTTLRLGDLPVGYVVDEQECEAVDGAIEVDDAPTAVTAFLAQNKLEGCLFKYVRRYRTSSQGTAPREVASVSVVAPDPAVAANAATLVPELIALMAGKDGYAEVAPPEKLGDETRLFHVANPAGPENEQPPASVLFWRQGRVLAGLQIPRDDEEIFRLAHLQQAHIDSPAPYTEAERDDSLVDLDDPRLRAPVYWLGERFAPGHGFPSARASFAFGSGLFGRRETRSPEFAIGYTERVLLAGWTRNAWRRFSTGRVERRDWTWHCTRSRRVKLRQGHAVLYAAYAQNLPICPSRPPRHYFAHVFLPGAVVGINQSTCSGATCGPFYSPAYGSFRGMAAIARHLHVRPPRVR